MRASAIFGILLTGTSLLRVEAQEADFSGVYISVWVGAPPVVILPDAYPFTPEAERAFDAFDSIVDDPRVGNDCAPRRMPALLWTADPVEFQQETGRIVIRYEVLDTVRTVSINGTPPPPEQPHTELGYSVGRWDEGVLIIETTHLLGGVIVNDMGQPISADARLTERYWRESGENDLQVEILVDDPVNYVEPLRLRREWVWAPNEEVRPWGCVSLGPEEMAIEEVERMLQEL